MERRAREHGLPRLCDMTRHGEVLLAIPTRDRAVMKPRAREIITGVPRPRLVGDHACLPTLPPRRMQNPPSAPDSGEGDMEAQKGWGAWEAGDTGEMGVRI